MSASPLATRPYMLLVDDTLEIGLIVRRLGKLAGIDVGCATDVPSARQALLSRTPEIVLLDLNLPGENGLVLCKQIRESAQTAELPIALFSHWDRPEDIVAGLEAGVDFVVSKDLLCRPADWQARMNELLLPRDSRPHARLLSLTKEKPAVAPDPDRVIHQVLRSVSHQYGLEFGQVLFRRALRLAGGKLGPEMLLPDGLGLLANGMISPADSKRVAKLARELADQLWCILGSSESATWRAALMAAIPSELEHRAES